MRAPAIQVVAPLAIGGAYLAEESFGMSVGEAIEKSPDQPLKKIESADAMINSTTGGSILPSAFRDLIRIIDF